MNKWLPKKHTEKNQITVIPQCKDKIQGTDFLHTYHCMAYGQHSMCIYNIAKKKIYGKFTLILVKWKIQGKSVTYYLDISL